MALDEQLEKIAGDIGVPINAMWMHPLKCADKAATAKGIIIPNGLTPSFEGQILCCKVARESNIPLLGICGGLQAAIVDVARHIAGFPEANSVEYSPGATVPVVHEDGQPLTTIRQAVRLVSGRYLAAPYKSRGIEGLVRCGRFVNRGYWTQLEQAGLELLATSANGERIFGSRLVNHPFYVGVAFLPQLGDAVGKADPLLAGFLHTVRHLTM